MVPIPSADSSQTLEEPLKVGENTTPEPSASQKRVFELCSQLAAELQPFQLLSSEQGWAYMMRGTAYGVFQQAERIGMDVDDPLLQKLLVGIKGLELCIKAKEKNEESELGLLSAHVIMEKIAEEIHRCTIPAEIRQISEYKLLDVANFIEVASRLLLGQLKDGFVQVNSHLDSRITILSQINSFLDGASARKDISKQVRNTINVIARKICRGAQHHQQSVQEKLESLGSLEEDDD